MRVSARDGNIKGGGAGGFGGRAGWLAVTGARNERGEGAGSGFAGDLPE